ncbi:hypothetical protein GQ457_08G025160 [Hibiscus cannabinus]
MEKSGRKGFCSDLRPPEGRWRTPPPPSSSAHRDESAGGRLATVGAAMKGGEAKEILVIRVGVVRVFESRKGGHHRVHQLEDSRPEPAGCTQASVHLSHTRSGPAGDPTQTFLDAPDPMAGSVSPNSNPVRETVMTVHLLNPICPNLLSLVNRLLPVLDGTFGQPSNSS